MAQPQVLPPPEPGQTQTWLTCAASSAASRRASSCRMCWYCSCRRASRSERHAVLATSPAPGIATGGKAPAAERSSTAAPCLPLAAALAAPLPLPAVASVTVGSSSLPMPSSPTPSPPAATNSMAARRCRMELPPPPPHALPLQLPPPRSFSGVGWPLATRPRHLPGGSSSATSTPNIARRSSPFSVPPRAAAAAPPAAAATAAIPAWFAVS
eukprot:365257-Chlamydomonas_euryale.AAC.5